MKLGNNSSLAKTFNLRSLFSRVSLESVRMPKYAIITTVLLALALLAGANIFREREAARAANAVKEQTQSQLANLSKNNAVIRQKTEALRHNKAIIAREAQTKMGFVRPNEIVLVVK